MKINTYGLILKQSQVRENDRLVTVLTKDIGVIRAFVRGAAKPKNKNASSTAMLCYSRLTLYQSKDSYIVEEAEPIEVFFDLRLDIEKLSLAQYFCEAAMVLAVEGEDSTQILRLILNCIHMIEKQRRPFAQIKAIFELRLMSECGYAPDLTACSLCGAYQDAALYFRPAEGDLVCHACGRSAFAVSGGLLSAMQHIVYAEFDRLFNFELKEGGYEALSAITEYYLQTHIQHRFTALDFYKNLPGKGIETHE